MSNDLPNRQSIRLRGYDYAQEGLYFVTICTHNREHLFGEIKNGKMVLNDVGMIVESVWRSLPNKFPVALHGHQIMPNHGHYIAQIVDGHEKQSGGKIPAPTLGQMIAYFKYESTKQINNYVGVGFSDPSTSRPPGLNKNPPDSNKYLCNPIRKWQVNHGLFTKIWQRNYYEHIIRSEKEYWVIKQYICDNPENWEKDVENV
jgi:putative transposase